MGKWIKGSTMLWGLLLASSALAAPGEGHLFGGIVHESPYYTPGVLVSYATPNGQSDAMTADARAAMVMPIACSGGSLRASLVSTDATYTAATVTLMLNGLATTSTCNLAGAISNCADTTHSFAIAAGDSVSLRVNPSVPQRPVTNDDSEIRVKLPFSWRCTE